MHMSKVHWADKYCKLGSISLLLDSLFQRKVGIKMYFKNVNVKME